MEIFGVLIIYIMPYLAGYVGKRITGQKEMSQIETYLTGFFLLFLAQGFVFSAGVFLGWSFDTTCTVMQYVQLGIQVIFLILAGINLLPSKRKQVKIEKLRKEERILLCCMLIVFILVVLKIFASKEGMRSDALLETVRTTLSTGTMFQYHPLTGQKLELGLITSKKIVTLPLYYAYLTKLTGMDPAVLLYDVLGVQTLVTVYFVSALLISRVCSQVKRKVFLFELFLGLLLLSGDYYKETLSYHLIYNGYLGMTISLGVILPYLLYLIYSWYMDETKDQIITWKNRILYLARMALCFMASFFITGLATGCLFLLLAMVVAGICCLLITLWEVKACRE